MKRLALSALLLCSAAHSRCTLRRDAVVAVYAATGAGGAGDNSVAWTRAFFAWFAAPNPALVVDYVADASEVAAYPVGGGCRLAADFPTLELWVQPGGSADNFSTSLGPGGRDNLLDFAASARGHYMGTCAGMYFAAGTCACATRGFRRPRRRRRADAPARPAHCPSPSPPPPRVPDWWFDKFYGEAWMPHWWPTLEGPVRAIATYPEYAPVALADGRTALYWGGPVLGLNHTTSSVPDGATVRATFDSPLLAAPLAAAYRYRGAYVNALLSTAHPEAVAGSGIACAPPLPAGCLTRAQQLANWQWLAAEINDLLGRAWVIPSAL